MARVGTRLKEHIWSRIKCLGMVVPCSDSLPLSVWCDPGIDFGKQDEDRVGQVHPQAPPRKMMPHRRKNSSEFKSLSLSV
mmetsp:Transcript_20329/g.41757  ORF Transcript_20329/g.41757 Transcript_20329/m.41757 type:complete len:80 (-) Transcript_20329:191-430(-)